MSLQFEEEQLSLLSLHTKIDENQIHFKMFPFVNKTISWNSIESAEVIQYGYVGGYGIKMFTKYGTVYNVAGHSGLALKLKNGKKLMIGTQKAEELTEIVNNIFN